MNDDELITAVREPFTAVHSATPVEQIVSRSRAIRARRRIPGVAGALAVAAGAALAVTAVLPATPANVGVFQAACVAVLAGAYHVSTPDAIAYGIVLQVVEVTTALIMGVPALLNEGMSWRDVRLRAMHAAPVRLPALPESQRHVLARKR